MNTPLVCHSPVVVHGDHYNCGRCLPCRKKRASQWGARLSHEAATMGSTGLFVLLTYNPDNVPVAPSGKLTLSRRDVQLFVKRLRKAVRIRKRNPRTGRMVYTARKLRVFYCGEYGTNTNRPHYHFIIFGLTPQYRHLIWRCWRKCDYYDENCGTYSCQQVDVVKHGTRAYRYVAGYTLKRKRGESRMQDYDYDGIEPEFQGHSLGIGYDYCDTMYLKDGLYMRSNGKWVMPPRAYRKRLGISHVRYHNDLHHANVSLCNSFGIPPPIYAPYGVAQDNAWRRDPRYLSYVDECYRELITRTSKSTSRLKV